MRGTWYIAPAIVISGSSPDPDAVTRSTGTGPGGALGFSFFSAATLCCTVWMNAALVGPEFEAVEVSAAEGSGVAGDGVTVTQGTPWKDTGLVQCLQIRAQ